MPERDQQAHTHIATEFHAGYPKLSIFIHFFNKNSETELLLIGSLTFLYYADVSIFLYFTCLIFSVILTGSNISLYSRNVIKSKLNIIICIFSDIEREISILNFDVNLFLKTAFRVVLSD